jgi:hypothetical protein
MHQSGQNDQNEIQSERSAHRPPLEEFARSPLRKAKQAEAAPNIGNGPTNCPTLITPILTFFWFLFLLAVGLIGLYLLVQFIKFARGS